MKSIILRKSAQSSLLIAVMVLALFSFAVTSTAHAQNSGDGDVPQGQNQPQGQGQGMPPMPPSATGRPALQTIENRIANNRDVRNTALEQHRGPNAMGSTTPDMRPPRAGMPPMGDDMRNDGFRNGAMGSTTPMDNQGDRGEHLGFRLLQASTTGMFKRGGPIKSAPLKKMDVKSFTDRKNALLNELTVSLTNISNISTRLDSYISKAESAGQTMTDVRALLTDANTKLAQAKSDVAAFQALPIPASGTASTTSQVDLTKPRAEGDTAIKSVKDARDAFQKVATALAHALGHDNSMGTTTPPTPPAPPTSTSTQN